jgi:hypothetical protein
MITVAARLHAVLKALLCVHCWCLAAEGEDAVRSKLRAVGEEIAERFRTLEEEFR